MPSRASPIWSARSTHDSRSPRAAACRSRVPDPDLLPARLPPLRRNEGRRAATRGVVPSGHRRHRYLDRSGPRPPLRPRDPGPRHRRQEGRQIPRHRGSASPDARQPAGYFAVISRLLRRDQEVAAPILLPAGFVLVATEGLFLPFADQDDTARLHSEAGKIVLDRRRSAIPERQVVLGAAARIAVALDRHLSTRPPLHPVGVLL